MSLTGRGARAGRKCNTIEDSGTIAPGGLASTKIEKYPPRTGWLPSPGGMHDGNDDSPYYGHLHDWYDDDNPSNSSFYNDDLPAASSSSALAQEEELDKLDD